MRDFPSATRTEYLSDFQTPLARLTLRQLRLDFGSTFYVDNDGAVIDGTYEAGDDFNDPDNLRVVWGDSCVQAISPYNKFRLLAEAAWLESGSDNSLWRSHTTGASWGLTAMNAPETIQSGCRIGVYPKSDGTYRVWYVNSSAHVKVSDLDPSTWGWTAVPVTTLSVAASGVAIHPVSESEAILVYYEDPGLYVRYIKWDGGWTTTAAHCVHMSDTLTWADAQWSDAVVNPDESTEIVVALNMSRWGSSYSLIYNVTSGIWSHPREILPSAEQWGNLKVWLSGLSVINSRIWGVTVREPVASNDVNMAHHVALVSSPDGRYWRDEGYITTSTLRGKLLYQSSEGYCYVVGNASVARAVATNLLGYDNASLKHQLHEETGFSVSYSGPSSAPVVMLKAINDSETLSDSGLLEMGSEIHVELGAQGESYGDYCRALMVRPLRQLTDVQDGITLQAAGYMSRIVGNNSYRPVAARVYDGPYHMHTLFEFENKRARLSVKQQSGTWVTERVPEASQYVLFCKKAGISLVPHSMASQYMIARIAFQAKVSLEGNYLVFWWEDESNYWQAGVYANPTTGHRLVIDRYQNGTKTNKADVALSSIAVETWYTLYLETVPGQVRLYFNNSDSYDFSSPTQSTSYDVTVETTGIPEKHHMGLKVEEFVGWEGAVSLGTVDDAGDNFLEDTSETFTSSILGQYVRCNDQDRRIADYKAAGKFWIEPSWADVPTSGMEYGIYPASVIDGPQAWFKELFLCEGIIPWSVDDVANDILELSGVTRDTSVYTDTDVPLHSGSPPIMHDVDVTILTDDNPATFVIWASTTATSGDSQWHGLRISITKTTTSLIAVEGSSTTTLAVHPNAVTLPDGGTNRLLRIQATKDVLIVSCDGHFVTAFDVHGQYPGGYVFKEASGDTATKREFVDVLDSFLWDANQPASAALSRLLRGRRAKMIERDDGSVGISRFDSALGDAGTYETTLVALGTGEVGSELVSLIEMVGAEERAFYLHEESARKVLRYVRADNPTLETQLSAYMEANRMAVLSKQRSEMAQVGLHIQDPALELEDQFTADGEDYIASTIQLTWESGPNGEPNIRYQIAARKAAPAVVEGDWGDGTTQPGDCDFDDGTQYGG